MPERDSKGHFIKRAVAESAPVEAVSAPQTPVAVEAGATPTLPILVAVNALLAQIRYNHPEIPNVTIVLGAQGATRRGQVHGHFAPDRWSGKDAVHEIMLSGESLARGAHATLGTLLHECAHAIANVRGVKDTSNNGRYHNKRFKGIAEDLGIVLDEAPTLGWSITSVPDETIQKYKDEVDSLAAVLTTFRRPPEAKEKKPRNSTKFKIECDCEDNEVTVSKQWFEKNEGALKCDNCLSDYRVAE